MEIALITGTHPRHAYLARAIASTGYLSTLILEKRETFLPLPPTHINKKLKKLFTHHFNMREETEYLAFGKQIFPEVSTWTISKEQLNNNQTQSIIKNCNPDLLLTYGCHMLTKETLGCAKKEKWNCHGGLSPWYKGAITHFWPSYMLEPQMTGMTVHDLTSDIDAGKVVHQCIAPLERGDKLHDLAVKVIKELAYELPVIINKLALNQEIVKVEHTTSGMLWLGNKWRPEHLEVIYNQYNNSIVDHYLDGKFQRKEPILHRQL